MLDHPSNRGRCPGAGDGEIPSAAEGVAAGRGDWRQRRREGEAAETAGTKQSFHLQYQFIGNWRSARRVAIIEAMRCMAILVLLTAAGARAQNVLNPAQDDGGDEGFRPRIPRPAVASVKSRPPGRCSVSVFAFRRATRCGCRCGSTGAPGHSWYILTRVTPAGETARRFTSASGCGFRKSRRRRWTTQVAGGYVLGEGRYDVAWKLTDDSGRVCSHRWSIEAKLGRGDRKVKMALPPNDGDRFYAARGAAGATRPTMRRPSG